MSNTALKTRLTKAKQRASIAHYKSVEQAQKNRLKGLKAGYDSIKAHPQRRTILPENDKTEDQQLEKQDRLKAIATARNMVRNYPLVKGMIARFCDCIIGPGSKLKIKTQDKEADRKVEDWFNKVWALPQVCDGRKRMDLWSYQRAVLERCLVDGESIVWFDEKGGQMFGFEADQLATPTDWQSPTTRTGSKTRFAVDGIVTDRFGMPTDFIISPTGKRNVKTNQTMSFKADRILHLAEFRRFRQVHGISMILHSAGLLTDLQDYMRSDLLSSKAAAKFAMWTTKKDALEFEGVRTGNDIDVEGTGDDTPTGGTSAALTEATNYERLEEITGGAFEYLNPGEAIGVIKPERPNQAFADYVRAATRFIGSGNSLPLEMVLLDFSQTNYSSARAAILLAWMTMLSIGGWFDINFNTPMAMRALRWGEKNRGLVLPEGWETGMKFTHPKLPEIDRVKAVRSQTEALEANTTTLRDELEDWEDTQEQRGREIELQKKLGLINTGNETSEADDEQTENNQSATS